MSIQRSYSSAFAGLEQPPYCAAVFFTSEDKFTATTTGTSAMVHALRDFVAAQEPLPKEISPFPDVVVVVGTAAFLVEIANAETGARQVRGFRDGTVVLLNGLLAPIANARGAQAFELETFLSALQLSPMREGPMDLSVSTRARPPSSRRKRSNRCADQALSPELFAQ